MLRSAKELKGYTIQATDGNIGTADEFYFDDIDWTIRYLVANTGNWLTGRKILISPSALKPPEWACHVFPVTLAKNQIQNSPGIDTHAPLSRKHQRSLSEYYGWPLYWAGEFMGNPSPPLIFANGPAWNPAPPEEEEDPSPGENCPDCHLQSTRDVRGLIIQAADGAVGQTDDFILDDETWVIRFLVVDAGTWLPGKKFLINPRWARTFNWPGRELSVDHTREEIKHSPEFNPLDPVNRKLEEHLYDYYGRPQDW